MLPEDSRILSMTGDYSIDLWIFYLIGLESILASVLTFGSYTTCFYKWQSNTDACLILSISSYLSI